jgi:hypothetical protein
MKTKRRAINLLVLAFLAAAVVVSDAYGQDQDLANLREYIQKNDELLKEAEIIVRGTNSAKARAALDAAKQLHLASKNNLEANRGLLSLEMAKRAREAILKAIQLAKREAKLEERAQRAIEHASRRNEQARTLLDETGGRGDVPAKKLIEESLKQLFRARNNMREHMFEVAYQSASASIDLSNRAIRILKRNSVGPELVRREIARTEQLLDRIDDRADRVKNPDLTRLIDEAHRLQDLARANASEGRYLIAFEETKRARTIARRIINRVGGSIEANEQNVARALELTDKLIERAYEITRENEDNGAGRRLDEAARLQRNAHEAFRTRRYDQALSLTRRAREAARDTMRAMNREIDAESVRQTLERTDGLLSRLGTALQTTPNEQATALFERASNRQAAAWNALNSGDSKKALANTKVARNLANSALRLLDKEPD